MTQSIESILKELNTAPFERVWINGHMFTTPVASWLLRKEQNAIPERLVKVAPRHGGINIVNFENEFVWAVKHTETHELTPNLIVETFGFKFEALQLLRKHGPDSYVVMMSLYNETWMEHMNTIDFDSEHRKKWKNRPRLPMVGAHLIVPSITGRPFLTRKNNIQP